MDDSTNGTTERRSENEEIGESLHVELIWTNLEDFAEHFEYTLFRHGQSDSVTYTTEGYHPLLGNVAYHEIRWNGVKGGLIPGAPINGSVDIYASPQGRSQISYSIFFGGSGGSMTDLSCFVTVSQFRRDRLKVVVWEYSTSCFGDRLKTWLEARWGVGGIEHITDGAPKPEAFPLSRPGRPPTKATRYAYSQFEKGAPNAEILPEYSKLYSGEKPPHRALSNLRRHWRKSAKG